MNTEEFIKKAKEINGDNFDYSKTIYTGTHKKVIIFCKKHQCEFSIEARNHLKGVGCKQCKNEKIRKALSFTKEEFIEKANKKYNNKFDYSKVNYINIKTNVIIICKEPGEFIISPESHLEIDNGGCPNCEHHYNYHGPTDIEKQKETYKKTCLEKYGVENTFQAKEVKEKIKITCINNYGKDYRKVFNQKSKQTKKEKYRDENYNNKEKNKQTCLKNWGVEYSFQAEECKEKSKQTNVKKYGVENQFQRKDVREKAIEGLINKFGGNNLSEAISNMNLDLEIQEKRKNTLINNIGVDCPFKLDEVKNKAKQSLIDHYGGNNINEAISLMSKDPMVINKKIGTSIKNWGTEFPSQSKEFQDKLKESNLNKYNVPYIFQYPPVIEKINDTKLKNGTFSTSKNEEYLYNKLINIFNKNDVLREYSKDKRYPFHCDFYIKSLDLFIELNEHATHGGHWFNQNSKEDIEYLNKLQNKNSKFCNKIIEVWTKRDVEKRNIAKKNKLNYVVLWDKEDIDLWLLLNCPISDDYNNLYNWVPYRQINIEQNIQWPEYLDESYVICTKIAKKANCLEFFKRELYLWNSNIKNQIKLYNNRFKYINKKPHELSDLEILRGFNISGKIKAYSTFNNTGFLEVISKYQINSVYDFCAGWGERLATCVAKNIKYLGIDINKEVVKGLNKIIEHYKLINQIALYNNSENFIPNNRFELIFTCPPYFNQEIYTEEGAENLDQENFLKWWEKSINNALNCKPKYFAYQINQKNKDKLNDIIIKLGLQKIDQINIKNSIGHFNKNNKKDFESIEIFMV